MKLAFAITHFSPENGGAEGFAVSLLRELQKRGHEIHVLCNDGTPMPGINIHVATHEQIPEYVRAIAPDRLVDWGLTVPADMHRLGGGTHAEFLRFNLLGHNRGTQIIKKLIYFLSPKQRRIIKHEHSLLTSPGTVFIAVSEFIRQQILRTAPVNPGNVKVLINGVDSSRFAGSGTEALRRECRDNLGLKDNQPLFIFVGHNLRLKNLDLLLRIFSEAAQKRPDSRLLILGKRRPRANYPWLIYAGTTREPEKFYAAADVLLHPTYYDACANVVLEAMAAGLTVVSSELNGSAEIISTGTDGFVLPVTGSRKDVFEQWDKIIGRLAADPQLRSEIGANAARRAAGQSMQNYTDAFEKILLQPSGA